MERPITDQDLALSAGRVRAWLRDTDTGRKILREAAKGFLGDTCRNCQRLRPYPRVLVVLKRFGGIGYVGAEVFHEPGTTVRIEEMIGIDALPCRDRTRLDALLEDLLYAQLPRSWKHLTRCRSVEGVYRGITAERRIKGLIEMGLIRENNERAYSS